MTNEKLTQLVNELKQENEQATAAIADSTEAQELINRNTTLIAALEAAIVPEPAAPEPAPEPEAPAPEPEPPVA